jgi:hypothetical protein
MRSNFSNSTNPNPRHLSGLFFSVATRTEIGEILEKCVVTESRVAVKGRFPIPVVRNVRAGVDGFPGVGVFV